MLFVFVGMSKKTSKVSHITDPCWFLALTYDLNRTV